MKVEFDDKLLDENFYKPIITELQKILTTAALPLVYECVATAVIQFRQEHGRYLSEFEKEDLKKEILSTIRG